jgi:hypothetical protein
MIYKTKVCVTLYYKDCLSRGSLFLFIYDLYCYYLSSIATLSSSFCNHIHEPFNQQTHLTGLLSINSFSGRIVASFY